MNHSETIEAIEEEVRPGLVAPAPVEAPAEELPSEHVQASGYEGSSDRAKAADARIAELVALAGLGNCLPPARFVTSYTKGETLEWDKPGGVVRLFFGFDGTVRASVTRDGEEKASDDAALDGEAGNVTAMYAYAMARAWVGS